MSQHDSDHCQALLRESIMHSGTLNKPPSIKDLRMLSNSTSRLTSIAAWLLMCSFCLILVGCSVRKIDSTPTIRELRIAAAANLKPALEEIIPVFNQQHP